jgi:integrase
MKEESKRIYRAKSISLSKRALKDAIRAKHPYSQRAVKVKDGDVDCDILPPIETAKWAISFYLKYWQQDTWRLQRCALLFFAKENKELFRYGDEQIRSLEEMLYKHKGISRSENKKNKKSYRRKTLTDKDLKDLEDMINSGNYKFGKGALLWLKASIATGLRPNEWKYAELIKSEDERYVLKVKNFKHNEVRSYGEYRYIDLTEIPSEYFNCVKKQLEVIKAMVQGGVYDKYYKSCLSFLTYCNNTIWKRRKGNVCLYTARHQFSANAKSDPHVPEIERAALMGHKTTKTSRERYGRKISGKHGMTPQVYDKDVLLKIQDPLMKQQNNPNIKK